MIYAKLPHRVLLLCLTGIFLFAIGCSDSRQASTTSPILSSASVTDFNGFLDDGADIDDLINSPDYTVITYDPDDDFVTFTSTLDEATVQSNPALSAASQNDNLLNPTDLLITFSKGYLSASQITGQTELSCLDLAASHQMARSYGSGIRIAILDTGFELNHPYLVNHFDLAINTGLADPQAGTTGAYRGHGSHVAGIIATLVPDAELVPLRVMTDDGVGSERDLIQGLRAARDNNVDIVNLSLSITDDSPAVQEAIQLLIDDGVFVVAAAGNDPATSKYPARYSNVIGVASTSNATCDQLLSSSGNGVGIVFAAAGEEILSASHPLPSGAPGAAKGTGSSMSAAVFSGSLALNMDTIRRTLVLPGYDFTTEFQSTALPITPYGQVEWGAIDLLAAITQSAN